MAKRKKTRRDTAEIARDIVERATGSVLSGGDLPEQPTEEQPEEKRGQKGGEAGGPARAAKLTPEQRSEIAKKAAHARWSD